ncbi:MAG: cryptochrome/photolyase family protein [Gammaproteobacteria bacterium]|nr:cryptochrome/photolyase family protein [Gammaproteobacteria bacterium]
MAKTDSLLVVFGNQLFAAKHLPPPAEASIFLAEDMGLCTYVRHHQQKIVLFLAAMRAYADELRAEGYDVTYRQLDPGSKNGYEDKLDAALRSSGARKLLHFEIEDKPMESRLIEFARERNIERRELRSPMFSCSREDFEAYASGKKRLLMADFYKQQRQRLGILIDEDGQPLGGRWSFDEDNRKKLPKSVTVPEISWASPTNHATDVVALVEKEFAQHPGTAADFCWPTTRQQAHEWLDDFVANRLDDFGPYEDAMTTRSATVFHSALTPCLNLGLLTPDEVVDAVLQRVDDAPLASVEGFVRQVIGWREFVRGIYREFSERQDSSNFWGHKRDLTDAWYEGTTGVVPLDDAIRTAQRLGWTHHIPRLMVLGNLMTLCEIRPDRAHRWFMEMYVDSSEWVMGPNVYGMGLFSDGGIFATKPYICGSNYLLKMSDYKKGPWCDVVDGLYWRFIDKHREFFSANPRLALMPRALDRLDADRRARITKAAETFLADHTGR